MDHSNRDKLVSALLNIYQRAIEGERKDLSHLLGDDILAHQSKLQVCALETQAGQIIGGVAQTPLTFANPNAENAVELAHDSLKELSAIFRGAKDFNIVAVAMSIPVADFPIYRKTFSRLGFPMEDVIFVHPETGDSGSIHTFPAYEPLS